MTDLHVRTSRLCQSRAVVVVRADHDHDSSTEWHLRLAQSRWHWQAATVPPLEAISVGFTPPPDARAGLGAPTPPRNVPPAMLHDTPRSERPRPQKRPVKLSVGYPWDL